MRRFDNVEYQRAVARCSAHLDRGGPLGYYQFDDRGMIDIICSTCLYIWVRDGRCMYVGQVRRDRPTGVADRFAQHHRRLQAYDGVWVIPIVPGIPPAVLNAYERMLITLYVPAHNRVGQRSPA